MKLLVLKNCFVHFFFFFFSFLSIFLFYFSLYPRICFLSPSNFSLSLSPLLPPPPINCSLWNWHFSQILFKLQICYNSNCAAYKDQILWVTIFLGNMLYVTRSKFFGRKSSPSYTYGSFTCIKEKIFARLRNYTLCFTLFVIPVVKNSTFEPQYVLWLFVVSLLHRLILTTIGSISKRPRLLGQGSIQSPAANSAAPVASPTKSPTTL